MVTLAGNITWLPSVSSWTLFNMCKLKCDKLGQGMKSQPAMVVSLVMNKSHYIRKKPVYVFTQYVAYDRLYTDLHLLLWTRQEVAYLNRWQFITV